MASKLPVETTAFAATRGGGKKRPRVETPDHLDFIRSLGCVFCGKPSQAAHVRYGDLSLGKPDTGAGNKPSDKYTVPLCDDHHRSQHQISERRWWRDRGVNPVILSALLWQVSGDHAQGTMIVSNAKTLSLWVGGTR